MKTVFLSICLFIGVQISFAQSDKKEQKTPEQRAEMMTKHLEKDIQLTQLQHDKIYAINLDFVQKNKTIRSNSSLSDEDKKSSLKENNRNRKQLVEAELTTEQKNILKAKRKKAKENSELEEVK